MKVSIAKWNGSRRMAIFPSLVREARQDIEQPVWGLSESEFNLLGICMQEGSL
jgi:hypothetical protein